MRGGHGRCHPPSHPPNLLSCPLGLPGPPALLAPGLSLQQGNARGQKAFTKTASLHPSITPSLYPPFPPSLLPSIFSSLLQRFPHLTTAKVRFLIEKKKQRKERQERTKQYTSPIPPSLISACTSWARHCALPCAQHDQAETVSRSLVKHGTVFISQPLILLTLLLFGPNPTSSVY